MFEIVGEATIRRQRFQSSYSRSRRRDGQARRLLGGGGCRLPHRAATRRLRWACARTIAMVSCMTAVDVVRPRSKPACRGALDHHPRRHRLDRCEYARPDQARAGALSGRVRSARGVMRRRLAKIAREVGARHAVVADPAAYRDLKDALSGSRTEAAAGEDALVEACAASGRLGHGGDQRCRRIEAHAGRNRTWCDCRARQQGMSCVRGQPVHAPCCEHRRYGSSGRLRAQCRVSRRSARAIARTSGGRS